MWLPLFLVKIKESTVILPVNERREDKPGKRHTKEIPRTCITHGEYSSSFVSMPDTTQ